MTWANSYNARWRRANPDRWRVISKRYRDKVKADVVAHYGKRCHCCGEARIVFLTIDHTNGNGSEHRRLIRSDGGHGFYCWLRRHGYPKGFRVACWNCNAAQAILGTCPHKGKQ